MLQDAAVDRFMHLNAAFLVSDCLPPNKEEKSEEAWEPMFSFGHFYRSVLERGVTSRSNTLFNRCLIIRLM